MMNPSGVQTNGPNLYLKDTGMRKIVQLAVATQAPETNRDDLREKGQEVIVTALCDDGSAWMIRPEEPRPTWGRLPDIPHD